MDVFYLALLWILLYFLPARDVSRAVITERARLVYSRDMLLKMNCANTPVTDVILCPPAFMRRDHGASMSGTRRTRKQGRREGVLQRFRRQKLSRIPLPSMIMANVQSLRNKADELQGSSIHFQKDFKDCGVLAFSETWLSERNLDSDLSLDGFGTPFCLDRNAEATGKTQGGRVCLYVNKQYCSPVSVTIREQICAPDVELLSVSLRLFYLPCEFPQIFITTVYIHPKANASSASRIIYDVIQRLQTISPEAPNFILGDFNHVSLEKTLTNFYQYVSCPTRRGKTLDLFYESTKGAFKSLPLPPLGSADHNCVYLLPTYKTVLKREKVQSRDVKVWTNDAVSWLQGCFDCTDWGMFAESCEDLDDLTDVVCSYSAFCRDMLIPTNIPK